MFLPKRNILPSFTLIELLIVVSIIAILTGAVAPALGGYLRGQSLTNAHEQLKNDLRSVQNKSLTGSMYDQAIAGGGAATPNDKVRYWVLKWTGATNVYRIYAERDFLNAPGSVRTLSTECTNLPNTATPPSDTRLQSIQYLPEGVTFSTATGCLYFRMSDGAILSSGGSTVYSGTVVLTQGSTTKSVRWNYGGLIAN